MFDFLLMFHRKKCPNSDPFSECKIGVTLTFQWKPYMGSQIAPSHLDSSDLDRSKALYLVKELSQAILKITSNSMTGIFICYQQISMATCALSRLLSKVYTLKICVTLNVILQGHSRPNLTVHMASSIVVFQPPSYQYKQSLPLVLVVCNIQSKTRPAKQSLVEVNRPSNCRSVNV